MPDRRFHIEKLSLEQIHELYEERLREDFPPDEIKPFSMIERAYGRGAYIGLGAADDGQEILAYAFFVLLDRPGERWALVDYYAVRRDLRNKGIGSRYLQGMIAGHLRKLDCVLLEVDDPDDAWDDAERAHRMRRLGFYLRNDLMETEVRARVFGMRFRILTLPVGKSFSAREVLDIYDAIYRSILDDKRYVENVKLWITEKDCRRHPSDIADPENVPLS